MPHRQATVDRTEPQATGVLAAHLVPAAEVAATVAEVVMLRVVADIPPVAAAATPVAAAIPAVIAKTKRGMRANSHKPWVDVNEVKVRGERGRA